MALDRQMSRKLDDANLGIVDMIKRNVRNNQE